MGVPSTRSGVGIAQLYTPAGHGYGVRPLDSVGALGVVVTVGGCGVEVGLGSEQLKMHPDSVGVAVGIVGTLPCTVGVPAPCVGACKPVSGNCPGTVVWGACGAVVGTELPCVGTLPCVGFGPHVLPDPSGQGAAAAGAASQLPPVDSDAASGTSAIAVAATATRPAPRRRRRQAAPRCARTSPLPSSTAHAPLRLFASANSNRSNIHKCLPIAIHS